MSPREEIAAEIAQIQQLLLRFNPGQKGLYVQIRSLLSKLDEVSSMDGIRSVLLQGSALMLSWLEADRLNRK